MLLCSPKRKKEGLTSAGNVSQNNKTGRVKQKKAALLFLFFKTQLSGFLSGDELDYCGWLLDLAQSPRVSTRLESPCIHYGMVWRSQCAVSSVDYDANGGAWLQEFDTRKDGGRESLGKIPCCTS
jgi:hypothetical protein